MIGKREREKKMTGMKRDRIEKRQTQRRDRWIDERKETRKMQVCNCFSFFADLIFEWLTSVKCF